MADVRNILFIMADQLRWDYLSCMGHPTLETPHIDALAKRGVLFERVYCQAPVCGPSRMSFYTGRYAISHGATYNNFPLPVNQMTLGDHLRPLGLRTALVGKTHMKADLDGMARLGIDPESSLGVLVSQCGFEPFERDDGLHPQSSLDPDLAYNRYLRAQGYEADNPWHDFANSAESENGEILSGWHMRNARQPARVAEEHSETAYMTDRAMDFIREAGDRSWCLHLSYIKPHWPYIAPAPYHAMYGPNSILAANRTEQEKDDPHPVVAAFMLHDESECFARQDCRETVIPTYMGLVRQLDDHIGRLTRFLEDSGRLDDTMIVFTSDHGDYLGDHWLGEKELFHDESVRLPMIVADPSPQADATRGSRIDAFVEAIDLVPTFIEVAGGTAPQHWVEGRSLLPLIRGDGNTPAGWRDAVFSESDYALRLARRRLGLPPDGARGFMVRTDDWKFIHYPGFRPQLFDMRNDPRELVDRGSDAGLDGVRREMKNRLFDWLAARKTRVGISHERIEAATGKARERGYLFGVW